MEPVTDAAEAAHAGDHKRALKALEKALYPLYHAGDTKGIREVEQEATRIAEITSGRLSKKAREIAHQADAYADNLDRVRTLDAAREQTQASGPTGVEPQVDVSPMSFGLTLVGAAVMLLAIFLKQFEANTFAVIEKNTLIQNGGGWWFILLAVIIAGSAWRAFNKSRRTVAPAICGLIGIGVALFYGLDRSQLRLCSVASGLNCTQARPSIGIYAAGVGGLLALIGGWQMYRADELDIDEEDVVSDDPPVVAEASRAAGLAERLRALEALHAQELLSDAEYEERRTGLLDQI